MCRALASLFGLHRRRMGHPSERCLLPSPLSHRVQRSPQIFSTSHPAFSVRSLFGWSLRRAEAGMLTACAAPTPPGLPSIISDHHALLDDQAQRRTTHPRDRFRILEAWERNVGESILLAIAELSAGDRLARRHIPSRPPALHLASLVPLAPALRLLSVSDKPDLELTSFSFLTGCRPGRAGNRRRVRPRRHCAGLPQRGGGRARHQGVWPVEV